MNTNPFIKMNDAEICIMVYKFGTTRFNEFKIAIDNMYADTVVWQKQLRFTQDGMLAEQVIIRGIDKDYYNHVISHLVIL